MCSSGLGRFTLGPLVKPVDTAWAGETESLKEEIIRGILNDFKLEFYFDPKTRGKTYEAIIKDFSREDERTYAVIDALNSFLVISIPDKKRYPVCGGACSKIFRLNKVREDLVTATRTQGLRRKFTVPAREEDFPFDEPEKTPR
jgi:hypothetical protein